MGAGCPVCNGLNQIMHNCPDCGAQMIDYGGLESYYDPYSPYEELVDVTGRDLPITGDGQCIHLLQCPQCNETATYPVGEETTV
ncbi:MAG: hypothetical protein ABSC17_02350 [Thermacetogeniaceae bacterium]